MYVVGQDEIDAVTKVIKSQSLFRYGIGDECERFETRYAKYLGCNHFMLAASGSNALAAAMIAAGLGPGDGGRLPPHTYTAGAASPPAAGATPVIPVADQDLSLRPSA